MGDPLPIRYQPRPGQRGCGVIGLTALDEEARADMARFVETRGYRLINLENIDANNPLAFDQYAHLAILDVAIRCVDLRTPCALYWAGAISAAALPTITFTMDSKYQFSGQFPREFQPQLGNMSYRRRSSVWWPGRRPGSFDQSPPKDGSSLKEMLNVEFDLFEQDFLKAQSPDTIERYVKMQIQAGSLAGNYEAGTRRQFIGAIMGDQYNVYGQAGAVGPNAHSHDLTFNQVWKQLRTMFKKV
jgi:hypothetical protein